jgi:hypothetical protein
VINREVGRMRILREKDTSKYNYFDVYKKLI